MLDAVSAHMPRKSFAGSGCAADTTVSFGRASPSHAGGSLSIKITRLKITWLKITRLKITWLTWLASSCSHRTTFSDISALREPPARLASLIG
jgi:hypothetical protein